MSGASPTGAADDLIGQLMLAADELDVERMDELLDALRLQAEYLQALQDIAETIEPCAESIAPLEVLVRAPSLRAYAALRTQIN